MPLPLMHTNNNSPCVSTTQEETTKIKLLCTMSLKIFLSQQLQTNNNPAQHPHTKKKVPSISGTRLIHSDKSLHEYKQLISNGCSPLHHPTSSMLHALLFLIHKRAPQLKEHKLRSLLIHTLTEQQTTPYTFNAQGGSSRTARTATVKYGEKPKPSRK